VSFPQGRVGETAACACLACSRRRACVALPPLRASVHSIVSPRREGEGVGAREGVPGNFRGREGVPGNFRARDGGQGEGEGEGGRGCAGVEQAGEARGEAW